MPNFTNSRLASFVLIFVVVVVLSLLQLGGNARAARGRGRTVAPLAPSVVATMVSSLPNTNCPPGPGTFDATCNGLVNPSDTIHYTITVSNTAAAADDATGVSFTDTLPPDLMLVGGSLRVQPIAAPDTFPVTGNVKISSANAASINLLANDVRPETATNANLTVTAIGADNTLPYSITTANGGQVSASANDGTFSYNPAPGFTGTDTFTYTLTDTTAGNGLTATGTVTLNISGMIWFIDASQGANGDGRLGTPFNCLRGPQCFDTTTTGGAADDPNDNIFLYSGSYTGGFTLLSGQKLIGQGASTTLVGIAGITLATGSDPLPVLNNDLLTVTLSTGSLTDNVVLGSGNTLRGFTVANSGGANGDSSDVKGSSFGTLTIIEVVLNGTGTTLNLTTGSLAAGSSVSASSSKSSGHGLSLDGVSGSLTVNGISTFDNLAVGSAGVRINNSAGSFTFGAVNVDRRGSAGINVIASSGAVQFGAVTINNQNASATSGIAIDNTTGTGSVTMTSATVSNNNQATGIALSGNSGTISINGGAVTGTTSAAISVSGAGNAVVTVASSVTNSVGRSVQVLNRNGGSTTISGNITDTGTGINVANNTGGTHTFSGTTKGLTTGANPAVTLTTNAGATVNFSNGGLAVTTSGAGGTGFSATGGGTISVAGSGNTINSTTASGIVANGVTLDATFALVTSTGGTNGIGLTTVTGTSNFGSGSLTGSSGAAFLISGGSPSVAYGGSVTQNTAGQRAVDITALSGGTSTLSGAIGSTGGSGISIEGTAGTVTLSGQLTLSGTASVFKACNGTCAAPSGSGLTVNVTNANNTIGTTTAATTTGVTINRATIGVSGVQFDTVNTNGAVNGILLSNTGNSGGTFVINGTGSDNSGGLITNSTGDGISLSNTRNINLTEMQINTSGQSAVDASTVTNLTLTNTDFDSSVDHGFNGNSVTNLVISGGSFNRGGASAEPTCNLNGFNIVNLLGTNSITSATFSRSNTIQFRVNNTVNGGGQDTVTVTGTNWNTHTGPCAGDHLSLNADASANLKLIMNASVAKNVVSGGGSGVQVSGGGGSGNMAADITGLQTSGNTAGVVVAASGTSNIAFNVHGNKTSANTTGFSGTGSVALILTCTTSGTCQGQFDDNTITHTAGTAVNAMQVVVEGNGTGKVTVSNNVVSGNFQRGLQAQQRGGTGTGTLAIHVTNNTFTGTDAGGLDATNFETSFSGDTTTLNTMCLNLANNTASLAGGGDAYRFFNRAGDTFQLQNLAQASTSNAADVQTWVTTTKSNAGTPVNVSVNAPYTTSGGCATPTLPAADPVDVAAETSASLGVNASAVFVKNTVVSLGGPAVNVLELPEAMGSDGQITSVGMPARSVETAGNNGWLNGLLMLISPTAHSQGLAPVAPEVDTVTVNGGGSGFNLPAGSSFTITVDATVAPVGTISPSTFSVSNQGTVNFTGGSVQTDDPNVAGQQATITKVIQPENIAKAFNPTANFKDAVTTLTFTVKNDNPAGTGANATQVNFTDTFPANLLIANTITTNTCGAAGSLQDQSGGTVNAGDTGIKLVGGTLNAASTCTITVKVTSSVGGSYPNTTSTITSLEGATGLTSNTPTLTVSALTSAGVSVSGRVMTRDGRGVSNSHVSITDSVGISRTVVTGRGGVFNFDDVPAGYTYTVSVASQRFAFNPQIVVVTDQVSGLVFTAMP